MILYVLGPERGELFGTKWAYGTGAGSKVTEDVGQRCPVCQQTVGHLVWLPPHRIELSSAKPEKWGDFLWGSSLSGPMVSARFKTVYEAERLIGIRQFHPSAEIMRVGKRKTGDLPPTLPTYHLVEIERLGPELDEKASEVIRRRLDCTYCHLVACEHRLQVHGLPQRPRLDVLPAGGPPTPQSWGETHPSPPELGAGGQASASAYRGPRALRA